MARCRQGDIIDMDGRQLRGYRLVVVRIDNYVLGAVRPVTATALGGTEIDTAICMPGRRSVICNKTGLLFRLRQRTACRQPQVQAHHGEQSAHDHENSKGFTASSQGKGKRRLMAPRICPSL